MKRLLLNDFEVDLSTDISLPITYAISDVKNPSSRKQSLSKQSVLEGTSKNMVFFQSLYSMTLTSENNNFLFDPTIKITAKLFDNFDLIFDGFFKIDEVVINDKKYFFKFTLFSDAISFYKDLQKIFLTDLDFSEYNHTLNTTNIRLSLDTSVVKNGVPTANFVGGIPSSFGYLYGLIDNGFPRPSHTSFPINQLIPQVYFKEVVTKMFAKINQAFTFSNDNDKVYKRLMIGGKSGFIPTVSPTEINNRKVDVSFSSSNFLGNHNSGIYHSFATRLFQTTFYFESLTGTKVENQDILDQINLGAFLSIARTGTYQFSYQLSGSFNRQIGSSLLNVQSQVFSATISFYVDFVKVSEQSIVFSGATIPSQTFIFNSFLQMGNKVSFTITFDDNIIYDINVSDPNQWVKLSLNLVQNNLVMTAKTAPAQAGDLAEINTILPKIKCSDIFDTLIKLFNCQFEIDENKVLNITPFVDFYGSTSDAEDWSDKVDYSKEISIKSANFIDGKVFTYNFLKDNDYYTDLYLKETGRDYGNKTLEINSQFNKNEVKNELPFSTSVLVQNTGQVLILPTNISVDNGVIKPHNSKPRLYVYSGLRNGNYTIDSTTYTTYPQLGNFLNVDNPTEDIHFDMPDKVYYILGSLTNNNTFVKYYSKFFNENTNKDSKLVTMFVKLTANDISNLSFSKLKNIDGSIFRLNEVKNVDTRNDVSFECELIKVIKAESNQSFTGVPIPPPPVDNTTTLRLMNDFKKLTANFLIEDGITTYIAQGTEEITATLNLKIKNQTFTIRNTSATTRVTFAGTIDGVVNPIILASTTWRVFFDGTLYFKI